MEFKPWHIMYWVERGYGGREMSVARKMMCSRILSLSVAAAAAAEVRLLLLLGGR